MKNMDFLKAMIAHKLGVSEDDIHFREITKMNGIKLLGIACLNGSPSVVPCVYIDDILKKFDTEDKEAADQAVNEIVKRYRDAMEIPDDIQNICVKINKEFILDRAFVQVINAEKNSELLTRIPHRKIADLALVCRIFITQTDGQVRSAIVSNVLIEKAYINENELFDSALKNTEEKGKYICVGMMKFLGADIDDAEEILHIITHEGIAYNGASVLAFPEIVERFITQICPAGKKAFILPSSVHEILIHVGDDGDVRDLKKMVVEINKSVVSTKDFLSDSIYEFDIEKKELRVVA